MRLNSLVQFTWLLKNLSSSCSNMVSMNGRNNKRLELYWKGVGRFASFIWQPIIRGIEIGSLYTCSLSEQLFEYSVIVTQGLYDILNVCGTRKFLQYSNNSWVMVAHVAGHYFERCQRVAMALCHPSVVGVQLYSADVWCECAAHIMRSYNVALFSWCV